MKQFLATLFIFGIMVNILEPSFSEESNSKIGKVVIARGLAVEFFPDGRKRKIKKGMWISQKSKVSTAKKSFVRLIFIDKSSTNIGPGSSIIITNYTKNKPSILSLVRGQIRTFVNPNSRKALAQGQSTLFVKTMSAAMGVRGTDFIASFNPKTKVTNLDVIKGSVAMVNTPNIGLKRLDPSILDRALRSNRSVIVRKGMRSSVLSKGRPPIKPKSIPRKILKRLNKNKQVVIKRMTPEEKLMAPKEPKDSKRGPDQSNSKHSPKGQSGKIGNKNQGNKEGLNLFERPKMDPKLLQAGPGAMGPQPGQAGQPGQPGQPGHGIIDDKNRDDEGPPIPGQGSKAPLKRSASKPRLPSNKPPTIKRPPIQRPTLNAPKPLTRPPVYPPR